MAMKLLSRLVLATALPILASENPTPPAPPARSTPEGLLLLHRMQDGLGGAERLASIRDLEETIRAEARDATGSSLGAVRSFVDYLGELAKA